jgi:iron(III) transport system ATP-binding protein
MLALVGLGDFAERGASYLSGGQMQRVALARSLVHRPQVLLMDEPLSNLDARLRDRLRVLLRELQLRFKTTALYVTHDQQEALALADRIVVLDAGSVLQSGNPVDLYRAPASRTVAEFLGYGNLFAATFEAPGIVALGTGGQRLTTASPAGEQTAYAACIRPSDVRLTKADAAAGATLPNVMHGVVVMASFLGSYVQYRVDVAGLIWEAHCAEPPPDVRVGTGVALSIDPKAVLVVPAT